MPFDGCCPDGLAVFLSAEAMLGDMGPCVSYTCPVHGLRQVPPEEVAQRARELGREPLEPDDA